jgi:(p)ppGpp synthase/HD superfamily hydrolase
MISSLEADALARRAHGQDRNKSGVPFIEHVRRVAERVRNDPDNYAVPAALLHDTVEKGSMEWADLRAAGVDDRLLEVVDALTERDGEAERDYLARCAADPLALRIKRADILDKLDISDRAELTEAERRRVQTRARRRLDLLNQLATELHGLRSSRRSA